MGGKHKKADTGTHFFDRFTVDGEHSPRGVSLDVRDLLLRLKVGGVIVFNDISYSQGLSI